MAYRTIEIRWLPRSKAEWATFTAARREAGKLWGDLVERHYRIRRLQWKWPSKERLQKWAKGRYPNLHSQTVQQIIADFVEAVDATRQLRKHGHDEASYPFKKPHYKNTIYTNQAAIIRNGVMMLPNGKSGKLRIKLPIPIVGRLMEVRLAYGKVELVCEITDEVRSEGAIIGVDLGVNTLIAATDGNTAILISGREAKATVQWRNKRLASMQARQSKLTKGSRMWKRTQRRKYAMLDKAHRRIKDIVHKATCHVANMFPNAKAYVGKPFNEAAQRIGRVQAQQVSSASNAKIISLLDYKLTGAIVVSEAYSSQTCPVCGQRSKHRRTYHCKGCGFTAARDVVGATNIRNIGMQGALALGCAVPNSVHWVYPSKYRVATHVVPTEARQVAGNLARCPAIYRWGASPRATLQGAPVPQALTLQRRAIRVRDAPR